MDIQQYMIQERAAVDEALREYLPPAKTYPSVIHESMLYSVFAGGKRLRPILAIATIEKPKVEILEYISSHKTAALIRVSVRTGAILGNASEDELYTLTEYGENVGVAFQIVDDILDETQDREPRKNASNGV